MKQEVQPAAGQAEAEKRFVKRTVILSTSIALVLTAIGLALFFTRARWVTAWAERAIADGNYTRAISLLEALDATDERDALLLESRYGNAAAVLAGGDYEQAEALFSALGDYADSHTQILECRYRAAADVFEAGRYADAAAQFYALSGYGDSMERYDACRYAEALELLDAGERNAAFRLFADLGDYRDAGARAEALAVALTGVSDPALALSLAKGYSPEALEAMEALGAVRERLPQHVLAVGFYHTVALRPDGTVLAAGRNDEGQCDVGEWSDIVAIDAGAYHTVGLRSDGTVVAAGRNSEGQCSVGEWSRVTAIACTDYNTIALLEDGTVLSTGFQENEALTGWRDVTAIGGGAYQTVAVRSNGQLLASHRSAQDDTMSGLIAADASTGYAVGLCSDGTVKHTAVDLSGWHDVVAICAGTNGTFGLTANGEVLAYFFQSRNAIALDDLSGVVAIAAGGTHIAVLLEDGRVVVRGDNAFGQCDTAGWSLAAAE
ncbi:MAG: hypothetical protein PUE41_07490 [bacterium]|nr:hypothetical protein [bacterium]